MNNRKVWLNGELIPWQQATVPLLSHGFSRASAIFDVCGIHPGPDGPVAFRLDEHLKRLANSAKLLGMDLGRSPQEITTAVVQTVKVNEMDKGVVKIMAYWGEEAIINLVLNSPLDMAIFAIPDSKELHDDDSIPISMCICKWRKLHPETVPVAAKACANYLSAYLARKEAAERGFKVGLLIGTDGLLAEGSIESVFLVKDGVLKTPRLGRILSSISRLSIIEVASYLGIPVEETDLKPEDLFSADEIFTSHTTMKIAPVNRFEDLELKTPGPITAKLMQAMDDILNFRNHSFPHFFQSLM